MSGIASLYNIPSTQPERDTWSFAHTANHRDIAQAIYLQFNVALPEYILDPIPVHDYGTWVYQHQRLHDDINLVLGTTGFNLLRVRWDDPLLLAGFIQSNAALHKEICDFLNIA